MVGQVHNEPLVYIRVLPHDRANGIHHIASDKSCNRHSISATTYFAIRPATIHEAERSIPCYVKHPRYFLHSRSKQTLLSIMVCAKLVVTTVVT